MKQNAPLSFIGDHTLCMALYWLCGGSILAKLTETAGLSISVSNMVVAFPSTLLAFQVIGAFIYTKTKNKHRFLLITNFVWRLLVPLVFFTVLLPKNLASFAMVLGYIVMVSMFHICSPNYATWIVNSVSQKVKSNYFSVRETAFMVLYTILMLIYGVITESGVKDNNSAKAFMYIGFIQLILMLISLVFLFKFLPPPQDESDDATQEKFSLKDMLVKPFSSKPFAKLVVLNVIWNFGAMFIGNFASLYQVQILKIDFGVIIFWATVANLARIIATPIFAKIADKIGWKTTTMIGFLPYLTAGVLWSFATPQNVWIILPFASVCTSIMSAGFGIGLFKFQIATSEPKTRSLSFSLFATAGGISALFASAICSSILVFFEKMDNPPFSIVFLIGIALCVVVMLVLKTIPYKESDA